MRIPYVISKVPLSPEEIAELQRPELEWDDEFQTRDGREFRLSYDSLSIEMDGAPTPPFKTIAHIEQTWIDLQALFGVRSRLASDPYWGMFPEPTEPSIQ
jgi:hypothetical protein